MADSTEKKVVTLDNLKVVTDEVKTNYAKKAYVDQKLEEGVAGTLTFATDAEVAALLADTAQSDPPSENV